MPIHTFHMGLAVAICAAALCMVCSFLGLMVVVYHLRRLQGLVWSTSAARIPGVPAVGSAVASNEAVASAPEPVSVAVPESELEAELVAVAPTEKPKAFRAAAR